MWSLTPHDNVRRMFARSTGLRESFTLNQTIERNLRLKSLSEIGVKGARFLLVVLAARLLGPEDFGLYVLAFSFGSILSAASDFGLHLRLSREVAAGQQPPRRLLGETALAKLLLTCVLVPATLIAAASYPRTPDVQALLFLGGIQLLAQSWSDFWNHLFRGLHSLREESVLNLLHVGGATLIGAALLFSGQGVGALLFALLLVSLAANGVAWAVLWWRDLTPRRARLPEALEALKDAAPIGLAILLSTIFFRIDMVFLERMRGDSEVGSYGAAYRLLEGLLFLPAMLLAALFPAMADAARRDAREFGRLIRVGLRWTFLVAVSLVAVLQIAGPWLLTLLYGPSYADAGPLLRALSPTLLFIFPNYILAHALVAARASRWNLALAGVGVVVNVGLNFPAISRFGAIGAAAATGLTEVALFALGAYAVKRRLRQLEQAG